MVIIISPFSLKQAVKEEKENSHKPRHMHADL